MSLYYRLTEYWQIKLTVMILSSDVQVSMCYGGQPGTNGIPGMHGMPGSPGAPGRDGRDGAKGDQGSPGKTGPQGPAGAEGKKGDKGESGAQGSAGQKGQRGEKGESGSPGSPQLSSHTNWKECAWKKEDGKDSGVIQASDLQHEITMFQQKSVVGLSHRNREHIFFSLG